jgi:hypothetical protein
MAAMTFYPANDAAVKNCEITETLSNHTSFEDFKQFISRFTHQGARFFFAIA